MSARTAVSRAHTSGADRRTAEDVPQVVERARVRRVPAALLLLLTAAACLMTTSAASAKPDDAIRITTDSTPFTWEADGAGAAQQPSVHSYLAVECDTPRKTCHDILIEVAERGDLVVQVEPLDATVRDLDVHLYRSNAEGEPGVVVEEQGSGEASEKVRAEQLEPGLYLARTAYWQGAGRHRGTIALLRPGAPAPPFDAETIDHRGSVSAAIPEFRWTGVAAMWAENRTLVRVEGGGDLRVTVDGAPPEADVWFTVQRSDETGFEGRQLIVEESRQGVVVVRNVPPGWIAVEVWANSAVEADYSGRVELTPQLSPPRPATAAPAAPQPVARTLPASVRIARPSITRRRRFITGRASGGTGERRVEVAIVRQGRACREADAIGELWPIKRCDRPAVFVPARGTARWRFALPRRLPPGRYVAHARAVDAAGVAGPATARAFRIPRR